MSTRLNDEVLAWQINDGEVKILIFSNSQLQKIQRIRKKLKMTELFVSISENEENFIYYEDLIKNRSPRPPSIQVGNNNIARIAYTGGTTGRPKGAVITLNSDIAVMRNILLDSVPSLNRSDTFIGLQPMYHAVWAYILPCWIRGARQIVTPNWAPGDAFNIIQKEEVTIVKTVPTILIRLINFPQLHKYNISNLHTIIYGGSPMPVEKLREAIRIFGPILVGNYGQVEAPQTIATLSKDDHIIEGEFKEVTRLSSVGRPYTFVQVKLVDEKGREVSTGTEGEVLVKSDHIMTGYWKQNDKETLKVLRNGWLYTRDIGRLDEKGFLYLIDRKNEMIITGGLNVYPAEIEQVLYSHPAVKEAAVIGVPDDEWGESIKAFVVIKAGTDVTEQELIDLCKKELAGYKKPKSIEFRNSLPKSDRGKILRRKLRENYWID
jgi:acyl-CoA synthetase (AMP-forming)/AMP-acid ligase II